ncbi:glucose-methanol-choline oxidoreductase [Aspergillus eucalypticola CBS 122712]|uniref:Glucose-methanol-choline oxidoreductase n=1 Tax=Aspergillus eucalypticola (strain CBS 122712 / IBT 29274) TaxID=1448314 RepID=A0A317US92_ASPEC|nr:glucose-methanol-choline oxidoreductase [Aspergillus eucalypticola CBS 122712]PWY63978.1 glucose-methanol-choline oxidoreductase [Aspergillus eucalypticola CBS 122712]
MHSGSQADLNSIHGHAYDFIICGGGTSGCVIASRLARIPNISVLLVESGRDAGLSPDVLIPGNYVKQLQEDKAGLWELETVPQRHLKDRKLVFLRGKQLGGSSAVNYMALARGPAADYDEWARLTGNDGWKWESVLPLMKELEDFDPRLPPGVEDFARPKPSDHGRSGQVKPEMVPGVETFFKACVETGMPVCLDNNSGNPVGVGLAQFNVRRGERSYAANAFLDHSSRTRLPNLTIMTDTECDKIYCADGTATGVELYHKPTQETADCFFKVYIRCRREVVLCAGTFGSPKILMLSGIGPLDVLNRHGILPVLNSPGCGRNMLDHSIITCEYKVDDKIPAHNQIFLDPDLHKQAKAQYADSRTGPLAMYGSSGTVAFPRIQRLFESKEFADLDGQTQKFLLDSTRPSAEIWLGSGPSFYPANDPTKSYITHEMLIQNNLSKGTVTLRSRDPRDPPLVDPNFLSHPFDKRIAIETVRTALKVANTAAYRGTIERIVHGPRIDINSTKPDSIRDEELLDFIQDHLDQGYHSMGTCKMGAREDPTAVVDDRFRVFGMRNLRVADLSVCPILTCNHTQINAYLIGIRCAQEMEKYYKGTTERAGRL